MSNQLTDRVNSADRDTGKTPAVRRRQHGGPTVVQRQRDGSSAVVRCWSGSGPAVIWWWSGGGLAGPRQWSGSGGDFRQWRLWCTSSDDKTSDGACGFIRTSIAAWSVDRASFRWDEHRCGLACTKFVTVRMLFKIYERPKLNLKRWWFLAISYCSEQSWRDWRELVVRWLRRLGLSMQSPFLLFISLSLWFAGTKLERWWVL